MNRLFMLLRSRWKRLLLVLTILGLAAGLCTWQWERIGSLAPKSTTLRLIYTHPIPSAILSVLTAALIGFARDIWKKLKEPWATSIAECIDTRVRLLLSGFRRRYYRQLCYRHRFFNVRGLRTQGTFTLELDKVFVGLCMAPCNPQDARADALQKEIQRGSRDIWAFLASRHEGLRHLAIIGAPGSG